MLVIELLLFIIFIIILSVRGGFVEKSYDEMMSDDQHRSYYLKRLMEEMLKFGDDGPYSPPDSNQQIKTIMESENKVHHYDLMSVLSPQIGRENAKKLYQHQDDNLIKSIPNMKENYEIHWETIEYIFKVKYGMDFLNFIINNRLLIISKKDFYDSFEEKYGIDADYSDGEEIDITEKADVVIIYRMEFVKNIYPLIIDNTKKKFILLSNYFSAFDNYGKMLNDIYMRINDYPIHNSLKYFSAESIRKDFLPIQYIYGDFVLENGFIAKPFSIWYSGVVQEKTSLNKMSNLKSFIDIKSHQVTDPINELKKEDDLYFIYCSYLQYFLDTQKEIDNYNYEEISIEKRQEHFDEIKRFIGIVSKNLEYYVDDDFFKKPNIIMDLENNIVICLFKFDKSLIKKIKETNKKQLLIYIIDFDVENEHKTALFRNLYYHLLGYKTSDKVYNTFYLSNYFDERGIKFIKKFRIKHLLGKNHFYNLLSITAMIYTEEGIYYKHDLSRVYENDREVFENIFVSYMKYHGNLLDEHVDHVKSLVHNGRSDNEILLYIVSNVPKVKKISYKKKSYKITGHITRILKKFGGKRVNSYLDIGAIDDGQIKAISDKLKISYNRCYGINIDEGEGYISYDQYDTKKSHIVMYDGYNIPVINGIEKYDLISIFSVLHHIPEDVLQKLAKNIYQKCGRYLIIKDNDVIDYISRTYFLWQHHMFNTSLLLNSYTRVDLNLESIRNLFEGVGFKFKGVELQKNFVRRFFILFEK